MYECSQYYDDERTTIALNKVEKALNHVRRALFNLILLLFAYTICCYIYDKNMLHHQLLMTMIQESGVTEQKVVRGEFIEILNFKNT